MSGLAAGPALEFAHALAERMGA
ncbi:MAG: hypothetical protein QOK36_271, partial [Gaiellales bacterium]|nr:hypothetical protein [Gaiellales bacterium]